jgi:hypothetical protein
MLGHDSFVPSASCTLQWQRQCRAILSSATIESYRRKFTKARLIRKCISIFQHPLNFADRRICSLLSAKVMVYWTVASASAQEAYGGAAGRA